MSIKHQKGYRLPGMLVGIAGVVLSVVGIIASQQATADTNSVLSLSQYGFVLIATGIVLVVGSIIVMVVLFSISK